MKLHLKLIISQPQCQEIDRLISDVVPEKNVAETSTDKGKRTEETSSEDKNFDLWHLGGQQLS